MTIRADPSCVQLARMTRSNSLRPSGRHDWPKSRWTMGLRLELSGGIRSSVLPVERSLSVCFHLASGHMGAITFKGSQ